MRAIACLIISALLATACSSTPQRTSGRPSPGAHIPSLAQLAVKSPPEECRIKYWEDGDTPIVFCGQDAQPTVVRLVGIDTAESGFDDNSRRRARMQVKQWGMTLEEVFACGKAATKRVCELCPPDTKVQVVGSERGKYGRRLAYLLCNGINMNLLLVHEGLAGRYPYPDPPDKPSACPLKN
jgi:endonuclease YncB( thermonuclease family)